nr:MBOAT family protein [Lachnospiraceae bacterium]
EVMSNFERPYFAVSIKDFWRRWHISLSTWLRDYVYIPLGGNRKGKLRKHINLVLTFVVSGIWHGTGLRFVAWGLMHAFYQIAGDVTHGLRERVYESLGVASDSVWKRRIKQLGTFLLVSLSFVFFRADSLKIGVKMMLHMFTGFNPWILFGDKLFALGLGWKEMLVLVLAIVLLYWVGAMQEKGNAVSDRLMKFPLPIRWSVYILAILFIMVFGTYGYGFNAQDFIYGGF